MAQIDNIPQNEGVLDSLSKINGNFSSLNSDKIETDSSDTLTNKTINADNNTVTELTTASIKTTSKTGQGTKLVTGTNGTDGSITKWDVNGNAVSSSVTEAEIETLKSDATLNTDTDVSGNDWVLDEDDFASDSATKVPTQQSVKAYVDASGGGATIVRKTLDETVTSSTTLQDDDELVLPVGANEIYNIDFYFRFNANGAPDIKYAFTIPSGAELIGRNFDSSARPEFDATTEQTLGTSGSNQFLILSLLYIGSSNAGNIQFQFAQRVLNAATTTVLANSFFQATKIN